MQMKVLAFAAMAALTPFASAQLLAGNDQSAAIAQVRLVDVTNGTATTLFAAQAWGLAADNQNNVVYFNNGTALSKWTPGGGVQAIASITLSGTSTTTSMTGLAYNSATSTLVGFKSTSSTVNSVVFPVGFYALDVTTAVASLLWNTTGADFGGFDYDESSGFFYGLNDSTSTTFVAGGRGIYRLDIANQTATEIGDYPPGDTDIDGLAAGGGKLYLVNDVSTQPVFVFDLATNLFDANLPSPFSGTGGIFSGGAWYQPVPEPGTMIALAAGSALLLRRRKKS